MTAVFISYRRGPSSMLARYISEKLQAAGIDPFLDTVNLTGSGPFPARLRQAIQNADVLICLLAEGTLDSVWVKEEIKEAYARNKTLIPVLQEDFIVLDGDHPEHIIALLHAEGVKFLDRQNLYIDAAMDSLIKLITAERIGSHWETISGQDQTGAKREHLYHRFWDQLLAQANEVSNLHANIGPGKRNRIEASAGVPGLKFGYALHRHNASVYLYIDTKDRARNKAFFDALATGQRSIERAYGAPLRWERLDNNRASRITTIVPTGNIYDEAQWPVIQKALIDAMQRLEAALRPHLEKL
ncbi:MAG: DUF4268 domain-containing protein [Anaerolineae bacterium]|nr:DUF4268 domain-containing protein [Anaerolineae bacterium]